MHIVNVINKKIKTKCWLLSKCFLLNWFITNVSAFIVFFLFCFFYIGVCGDTLKLICPKLCLDSIIWCSTAQQCRALMFFICLPASRARAFVPRALSPKPMCLIVALGKPYFSALAMHGRAGRHGPAHIPRAQNNTLILLPLNWLAVWNTCQKLEWNEGGTINAKVEGNIVVDVFF